MILDTRVYVALLASWPLSRRVLKKVGGFLARKNLGSMLEDIIFDNTFDIWQYNLRPLGGQLYPPVDRALNENCSQMVNNLPELHFTTVHIILSLLRFFQLVFTLIIYCFFVFWDDFL